jgi:succinyl-diaminopimelate desuccinylase
VTDVSDLLARTAELVGIPSVSHHEAAIADHVEGILRGVPWLAVERVGENVVARTELGRAMRLVAAGHLDTVPPNGNEVPRVDGDVLWGLGSADMKGGVAVLLELARTVEAPAIDVTYVFYACEEVEADHNGLGHLARHRPELLEGDAAILAEPTDGAFEAGCQGSLHLEVTVTGTRAHTARPWKGENALHRLAPVLARLAEYEPREPVLDGCRFRESLQAVSVRGGVAGNVVPDRVALGVNHRFAPDRTVEEAEAAVCELLAPALREGDEVRLVDVSAGAPPGLDHPLLATLAGRNGLEVRAKLGWTDVARFAALGVPAVNFGPGDPNLAHTAEEHVEAASIERCFSALRDLLERGV